jgi:hypothetical protein
MQFPNAEVHRLLSEERAADLRRAMGAAPSGREARKRLGRSLISLGSRIAGEPAQPASRPARPEHAHA